MGETIISWTDRTWNPVVGCNQVSPGCAHCYAKTLHDKRHKAYEAGKDVPDQYAFPFEAVQTMEARLAYPLGWRKPQRIFVNSVSDLFHQDVPFDFIDKVFAVMMLADQHIFQILTKRPERQLAYMTTPGRFVNVLRALEQLFHDGIVRRPKERGYLRDWPFRNVWLGTSVENQRWADIRIPLLMRTPAALRFLSCEPLLGKLHLVNYLEPAYRCTNCEAAFYPPWSPDTCLYCDCPVLKTTSQVDWVIVGGESGPGHRPMDLDWARSLQHNCQTFGVPFFYKQEGGSRSETGKELDGTRYEQMPEAAA